MSTTCRSCGAAILWAVTPAGKRMPVDAQPTKRISLDSYGVKTFGDLAPVANVVDTYTSHFATCPSAAQHRKHPNPVEQASTKEQKKP